ncbi:MAG TPA: aspartyl/asparaginyl beta-hydroxylase domain-containing protein [Vicinamibacteria bacterium]|nr:aspartyl/asparaginyl beta-hydroxylase domain-containing protein [Vicinamibacteria bacterium]
MIEGILVATGAFFWMALGVLVFLRTLTRARVRRVLERPAFYAHALWLRYRFGGLLLAVAKRLGVGRARRVAPEVVQAFRAARVRDFEELRSSLSEMDELPTVRRGLEALGLRSLFDVPTRQPHRIPSPYTHRMQHPPYYVPGVPARAFYDPMEFEWARPLRDAYPVVREELEGVLQSGGQGFKGYLDETQHRLDGWNTFNLYFYGRRFEENCARCPRTTALLESLPRFERDHIMFSALNPHAHIPPHTGPMNGIIRAHLALVAPPGCYIRVGPEERTWQEGELLVFDDSFEHEVWNHSDHTRIVLFLNFWHPCFAPEEIPALERFRRAYERSPLGRVHEDNQVLRRAHDLALQAVARSTATTIGAAASR